ncbi:MAG: acyl-CoA thioesterase II [Myxococcales bacterium]|nr:acyl-CoA thioesterase II [Myxococcales bacterium]
MSGSLSKLVELLTTQADSETCFTGASQDLGWGTIFGGQGLGQGLMSAAQTVADDRPIHSLHAYFLRTGSVEHPVSYEVERTRDGRSFSTRRVQAVQRQKTIMTMSLSFHRNEETLDRQSEMPSVPKPQDLKSSQHYISQLVDSVPKKYRLLLSAERPFETRPVEPVNPFNPAPGPARQMFWYRTRGAVPDLDCLHRALLAYVSDFNFLTTALRPFGMSWPTQGIRMASLDHSIWFHRPFRCDEWLLHAIDSPTCCGGRALVRGQFFDLDGQLVASTTQEGMVRYRRPESKRTDSTE